MWVMVSPAFQSPDGGTHLGGPSSGGGNHTWNKGRCPRYALGRLPGASARACCVCTPGFRLGLAFLDELTCLLHPRLVRALAELLLALEEIPACLLCRLAQACLLGHLHVM